MPRTARAERSGVKPRFKVRDKALIDGDEVEIIEVDLTRPPNIYLISDGEEWGSCAEEDLTPINNGKEQP